MDRVKELTDQELKKVFLDAVKHLEESVDYLPRPRMEYYVSCISYDLYELNCGRNIVKFPDKKEKK